MTNQNIHTTAVRRAIARLHMNRDRGQQARPLDGIGRPDRLRGCDRSPGAGGSAVPRDASARRSKSATTCSASAVRPRSNR